MAWKFLKVRNFVPPQSGILQYSLQILKLFVLRLDVIFVQAVQVNASHIHCYVHHVKLGLMVGLTLYLLCSRRNMVRDNREVSAVESMTGADI